MLAERGGAQGSWPAEGGGAQGPLPAEGNEMQYPRLSKDSDLEDFAINLGKRDKKSTHVEGEMNLGETKDAYLILGLAKENLTLTIEKPYWIIPSQSLSTPGLCLFALDGHALLRII